MFILEVNPRASRTAPFVSKATGVPLPRLATQVMLGKTLKELDPWSMRRSGYVSVKESVFPFRRFPGVDIRSDLKAFHRRSHGHRPTFEEAFLKGQWGAGQKLPEGGKVFLSVNDRDKRFVAEVAPPSMWISVSNCSPPPVPLGFWLGQGIPSTRVLKVYEGRPNIVDLIKNGEVSLVINTASGQAHRARLQGHPAGYAPLRRAVQHHVVRREGHWPAPSVRPGPPKCA